MQRIDDRRRSRWTCVRDVFSALLVLIAVTAFPAPAAANENYAGIVIDLVSGRVLYQDHADARRYPASLTKMMTLYIVFEELEAGRLSLGTTIRISQNAATEVCSCLGLAAGATISVRNAILALVTKSANDVATAVAEHISGSEAAFARRMTDTARAIGMTGTQFRNAHGLPNSQQYTTARDMALLGLALQYRFPQYYGYFATESFTYAGVTYSNHNNLLGSVAGVDGIKTGYISAAGFNLVTSVRRDGRSIIAVVLGGLTASSRDAHMRDLIDRTFSRASRGTGYDSVMLASINFGMSPIALASRAPADHPQPPARPAALGPALPLLASAGPTGAAGLTPAQYAALVLAAPADSMTTATTATGVHEIGSADAGVNMQPAPGYYIQIGAFDSEAAAYGQLDAARREAASLLAAAWPTTEIYEGPDRIYIRARFGGFADEAAANRACTALRAARFDCFTVHI